MAQPISRKSNTFHVTTQLTCQLPSRRGLPAPRLTGEQVSKRSVLPEIIFYFQCPYCRYYQRVRPKWLDDISHPVPSSLSLVSSDCPDVWTVKYASSSRNIARTRCEFLQGQFHIVRKFLPSLRLRVQECLASCPISIQTTYRYPTNPAIR